MNTNQNDTFLNAPQKGGGSLQAGKIAEETTQWLRAVGCEDKVERHLIEQYAVAVSRWRQAEEQFQRTACLPKRTTLSAKARTSRSPSATKGRATACWSASTALCACTAARRSRSRSANA